MSNPEVSTVWHPSAAMAEKYELLPADAPAGHIAHERVRPIVGAEGFQAVEVYFWVLAVGIWWACDVETSVLSRMRVCCCRHRLLKPCISPQI